MQCQTCGTTLSGSKPSQKWCKDCKRDAKRAYHKERRAKLKAAGLCLRCEEPLSVDRVVCVDCTRGTTAHRRLKRRLEAPPRQCRGCGELLHATATASTRYHPECHKRNRFCRGCRDLLPKGVNQAVRYHGECKPLPKSRAKPKAKPKPMVKPKPVARKVCTKCGDAKPLAHYYDHPHTKDGKQSQCKPCARAAQGAQPKPKPNPCAHCGHDLDGTAKMLTNKTTTVIVHARCYRAYQAAAIESSRTKEL